METQIKQIVTFADFEIDPNKRLLLKAGKPVALNSKTFDLLATLIDRRGEVLSKNYLLETIWENQFVEENNLTVQISALRKIFGEKKSEHRFIVTVPGKGYKFVAELNEPPAAEIVIENHSFSRIIVVEEEGENEKRGKETADNKKLLSKYLPNSFSPRLPFFSTLFLPYFSIAITLMMLFGGYVWYKQRNISTVPFANTEIKQLTTNGKVQIAALSPDGKLFIYVTSDLGERSLWLGYVEGGNNLLLRPADKIVYHDLAFAPDGSGIYFSFRDEKTPKSALYKMPVSGGAMQKVLDDTSNFKLSPDGRQIAFAERSADADKISLVVADINTGAKREIGAFPKFGFNAASISWSPDNSRIACAATRNGALHQHDILLVNIADGKTERIMRDEWRDVGSTAWLASGDGLIITAIAEKSWSSVPQYRIWHVALPDGETCEITNDRSSYGASLNLSAASNALVSIEHRQLNNVWIAPPEDLSQARQITFSSFGKYDGLWGMDFTPDGKIIYTNSDTQSQFISQMNADGSDSKPLTASGSIDSQLTVTPDGRYIVFLSIRAGGFDIWRMNADGSNPIRLTASGKNYQPFVSADGIWVYYKSLETDKGELRRISIDGGAPETLNDKETSWGSASPDGKFFAAAYVTDKTRLAVFSAETNQIVRQFDLPKTATLSIGSRWTPDSQAIIYRDFAFGLWKQPIDGSEPQRLTGLPKEKFYNFAFSKDGKSFAFVRGQETRDVVLLRAK